MHDLLRTMRNQVYFSIELRSYLFAGVIGNM
jgi:hypothetical protein